MGKNIQSVLVVEVVGQMSVSLEASDEDLADDRGSSTERSFNAVVVSSTDSVAMAVCVASTVKEIKHSLRYHLRKMSLKSSIKQLINQAICGIIQVGIFSLF